MTAERSRRRTFGPVVLVGLVGAGVVALAGSETWTNGASCGGQQVAPAGTGDAPGATAVALALLAAWGVLLVTRGRVRQVVALLVALLAIGLVPAVLFGFESAGDAVVDSLGAVGVDCVETHLEGWFWVAVVALPFAVVPAVAAVFLVPTWPEMGRRYDAPASAPTAPVAAPEERENLDLWKDMDEGRDPTA
jgi:uncharacterized membrane protein (TIGR02234 family)